MNPLDETLKALRGDWEAVARYSVVRIRRGTRTVVAEGRTWTEAMSIRAVQEKEIQADPEYRAVMSRTIVVIELENKAAALATTNQGASRHAAAPDDAQQPKEGASPK